MGMTIKKEREFAFDIFKLVAMLLILNSHFDLLYPNKLKLLATGGSWGNTIFFLISGYFTKIDNSFFQYMKKRIVRLYPSVIIFTLFSLILQLRDISIKNIVDMVAEFIWPTYYWFVGALVLYYIIIYLLEKKKIVSLKFLFFSIVFYSVLLLYYECCIHEKNVWCMEKMGFDTFESWIKVISYFYVFALGYYFKENRDIYKKISGQYFVFITLGGGIGYMGYKLLLVKNYIPMCFQIVAPVFLYIFALGIFGLAVKDDRNKKVSKSKDTVTRKIVTCLSSLSLEVYVVQFPVIHFFESYIFPLNIVMALLVTFSLAYLLKKISLYCVRVVMIER